MLSSTRQKKADRLFVRDGRRTYRRRYSPTEVVMGFGVLFVLALVAAWVAWRGAHPDPALFEIPPELLQGDVAPAERGPLPNGLALSGWNEERLSTFVSDNLYEKINGREGYYKSFGFERLWFLSIVQADADDERESASPPRVVDIELFDLGSAANALGAYAGERPPDIVPSVEESGMSHRSPNALFMTRGRFYVRALGSDTGAETQALLTHLAQRFRADMTGEPLPWGYALFVGGLGLDPGRVTFTRENAFSFGFARNVYAARLGEDEMEVFVVAAESEDASTALAHLFTRGFLAYGSEAEPTGDDPSAPRWIEDRYRHLFSCAAARELWVLGVHRAPDIRSADAALQSLTSAISALPEEVVRRARAGADSVSTAAEADSEPGYKEETLPTLESAPETPEN